MKGAGALGLASLSTPLIKTDAGTQEPSRSGMDAVGALSTRK